MRIGNFIIISLLVWKEKVLRLQCTILQRILVIRYIHFMICWKILIRNGQKVIYSMSFGFAGNPPVLKTLKPFIWTFLVEYCISFAEKVFCTRLLNDSFWVLTGDSPEGNSSPAVVKYLFSKNVFIKWLRGNYCEDIIFRSERQDLLFIVPSLYSMLEGHHQRKLARKARLQAEEEAFIREQLRKAKNN